ncbi:MAG: HypC/HybG/HupF family hydrogenase formation chaperone [Gaiellaceae bacterium]
MCLGIPAQIVELVDSERGTVRAEIGGVRRRVSVALLEGDPVPGEWVLVHVGFALQRIDEREAQETLALLVEMNEQYDRQLGEAVR